MSKQSNAHSYARRTTDNPAVTLSWEHAAFVWADIAELKRVDFRPFYNEAIDYCFTHGIL